MNINKLVIDLKLAAAASPPSHVHFAEEEYRKNVRTKQEQFSVFSTSLLELITEFQEASEEAGAAAAIGTEQEWQAAADDQKAIYDKIKSMLEVE